jgi:hypothetical protein
MTRYCAMRTDSARRSFIWMALQRACCARAGAIDPNLDLENLAELSRLQDLDGIAVRLTYPSATNLEEPQRAGHSTTKTCGVDNVGAALNSLPVLPAQASRGGACARLGLTWVDSAVAEAPPEPPMAASAVPILAFRSCVM